MIARMMRPDGINDFERVNSFHPRKYHDLFVIQTSKRCQEATLLVDLVKVEIRFITEPLAITENDAGGPGKTREPSSYSLPCSLAP